MMGINISIVALLSLRREAVAAAVFLSLARAMHCDIFGSVAKRRGAHARGPRENGGDWRRLVRGDGIKTNHESSRV